MTSIDKEGQNVSNYAQVFPSEVKSDSRSPEAAVQFLYEGNTLYLNARIEYVSFASDTEEGVTKTKENN